MTTEKFNPKKLTKRQKMVLSYIIQHIDDHGYPPTIREIGDHMEIRSTNGVNDHLKALERKGYLERKDAKSRALRPVLDVNGRVLDDAVSSSSNAEDEFGPTASVPVLGRIAAGRPISAIEHVEDMLRVSQSMLGRVKGSDEIFALIVKGESMIEAGINDGDYIFVKRQQSAQDGEMVAAMVDGEATVKYFHREGSSIRLQPANSTMEPIYVHEHEALDTVIVGKVVGVFRQIS